MSEPSPRAARTRELLAAAGIAVHPPRVTGSVEERVAIIRAATSSIELRPGGAIDFVREVRRRS